MTIGVGGSSRESELAAMSSLRAGAQPITDVELEKRMERARVLMREQGLSALYLDASTSLYYFTGMRCMPASVCTALCCRPTARWSICVRRSRRRRPAQ